MKEMVLIVLFAAFMLFSLVAPVLSQDWTVGINVGDWFIYEGTLVSWEADSGVPFPPNEYVMYLDEYNQTDWYMYTVTDITGLNVTFDVVTHWSNGTETFSTLVEDIKTSFTMMVIGANFQPGTQIRPEYDWEPVISFPLLWPARILNETKTVELQAGSRNMNVLDWTHPPSFGYTRQLYHWDKEYGIQAFYMSESSATDFTSGGQYSYRSEFQLVDSNISVLIIPEYPLGTVMLLMFVAITVIADIIWRKYLKS